MREEVRLGLEAGARTFSFGLIYMPGAFSETGSSSSWPKKPRLRRTAGSSRAHRSGWCAGGGRDDRGLSTFGRPLHLSHLKVIGNPELVEPLLALIDEASADVDITFDQYPYGAGSTVLSSLLPPGRTREVHPTRSGAWTTRASARRWPATLRKGCPTGTTRMARAGPRTS